MRTRLVTAGVIATGGIGLGACAASAKTENDKFGEGLSADYDGLVQLVGRAVDRFEATIERSQ